MSEKAIYRASTSAPVNIAVAKYWGKRDATLNLPTNSSLSVTLSQSDLCTITTASCSHSYTEPDTLFLNSAPQDISNARTQACLRELRQLRENVEKADPSLPKLSAMPLKIVSKNNFPTAAGLASSASGFAALVKAIGDLYQLPATSTELSMIARQGSGSACRSLFGGYVAWNMGERLDGSDSVAVQIAPASHWPDMCALVLVVSATKKDVSSTSGMQRTVATSSLFRKRADVVVPESMREMEKAINERDFDSFARITMRESNSFHATCLDTSPPIFYLNDVSRAAIQIVEALNYTGENGRAIAAYTFDAGPNPVIFFEERNKKEVLGVFKSTLGGVDGWPEKNHSNGVSNKMPEGISDAHLGLLKSGISRVILTRVGEGPLPVEHLI